jgi:hypothetical protein
MDRYRRRAASSTACGLRRRDDDDRFPAAPPAAWVAADVVRMENGVLAEHWRVLQDEATKADSRANCLCSATISRMTQT